MGSTLVTWALANAVLAVPLALVAALVGRVTRRPALTHALWLLVLLKLVTPPLLPVALPWPREEAAPTVAPSEPADDATETIPLNAPIPASLPEPALAPLDVAVTVWLGGAVLWWTIGLVRGRRLSLLLARAPDADADLQRRVATLAERFGLRHAPRVVVLPATVPPFVWGRRLVLPTTLWARLDDDQRDAVLAHELAHLRRGDAWTRRLECLVTGLYWWHPVVWWARRELREAEEQCCDAWVLWALPDAASAYARALVDTVAFLAAPRPALPMGVRGMNRVRSLKRRLHMIVRSPAPRALSRGARLVLLVVAALLLPLLPTGAQTKPPPEEKRARSEAPKPPAKTAETPRVGVFEGGFTNEDEIARLRDEIELLEIQRDAKAAHLVVAETGLRNATERAHLLNVIAKGGTVSHEEQQKATHEVDLLKGQLEVKKVELREAEVRVRQAKRRLAALMTAKAPATAAGLFASVRHDFGRLTAPREAATSFRLANASDKTFTIGDVTASHAAVTASARSVELKPGDEGTIAVRVDPTKFADETTFAIRVRFTKPVEEVVTLSVRAVSALERGAAAKPAASASPAPDIERRLDALLKEVEELKKQFKGKERGDTGRGAATDIVEINHRDLFIPVKVNKEQWNAAKEMVLYVSPDEGKTWSRVGRVEDAGPNGFAYRAPSDGDYWFCLAPADDGTKRSSPRDAHLKVRVRAEAP